MKSRWSGAAFLVLPLVLIAACATAAPPEADGRNAVLAARASASTSISAPPAAQADQPPAPSAADSSATAVLEHPALSDPRRLEPPSLTVLVLGLPEPAVPTITSPRIDARLLSPKIELLEKLTLADPELPDSIPPLPATKAAALLGSAASGTTATAATAAAGSPPKPATKVAASTPPAVTSAAAPVTATPVTATPVTPAPVVKSAPPAPRPAPVTIPAPSAAAPEAIPSAPPSLAPWIDVAAQSASTAQRSLSAEAGAKLDIPFVGTGWTYLGERDGKSGVLYDSRRFEGSGSLFTIATNKPGDYVLRFMRQDLAQGTTSEELVRLTVTAKAPPLAVTSAAPIPNATSGSLSPPLVLGPPTKAASAMPAGGSSSPNQSGNSGAASTAPAIPSSAPAPDSPEGLLATARAEYAAARVPGITAALDRYLNLYPAGEDEVYWLYGQALELNTPLRDIKRAWSMYKQLMEGWPRSAFWNQAQERVSYIERHYLDIR